MLPVVILLFDIKRLSVESGFNLTFKSNVALAGPDLDWEVIPKRGRSEPKRSASIGLVVNSGLL